MDSKSFFYGFIFCMVCDVIFSFCKYCLEKAFFFRSKRKEFNDVSQKKLELIEVPFLNPNTGFHEVLARGPLQIVYSSKDYNSCKRFIENYNDMLED